MIADLGKDGLTALTADVVVVGGGIAGLILATHLRRKRMRVAVLESGGMQSESRHPLNNVVLPEDNYRGAVEGRARGIGGTSTQWGGALIPLLQRDFEARPHLGLPAWPVQWSDLHPYLADAEHLFGLDESPYDLPTPEGHAEPEFLQRLAKWPAFRKRNVYQLLRDQIASDPDLVVVVNATVTEFQFHADSNRIAAAVCRCDRETSLTVIGDSFVLCAGAIESTRLLLLLNRQSRDRAFEGCSALGRYFHDHLSTQVAEIQGADPIALNSLAAFHLRSSGRMRSLRFELSPKAQLEYRVPSAFGHISFRTDKPSGFDALRDALRSVQRSGRIDFNSLSRVASDLPYLTRAAWWRAVRGRLYWPSPATYHLHVVAEQLPHMDNRVTLARELDRLGQPLAAIAWKARQDDFLVFDVFLNAFQRLWRSGNLGSNLGHLHRIEIPSSSKNGARVDDVFHPGGSTRMGNDGRNAVVDRNLRTFAVPNLYVAATSVFPASASSNPTLTLILMALRLADHLKNKTESQ